LGEHSERDPSNPRDLYAVVFEVRDGRIAAVREYFDTGYAQRMLFVGATQ
jgi:ketosteroid isomerase-like protein